MNLWRLQNGQFVQNWDHPELVQFQEPNGPKTQIIQALFDRMKDGPVIATAIELAEIERMNAHGTR